MSRLEEYREQVLRCSRCSICKWVPLPQIKSWRFAQICPSIQKHNFHAYSGGGKVIIAGALAEGKIDWTDELIKILYSCSLCGACDVSCKMNMGGMLEPFEIMHELRIKCVEEGKLIPRHKELLEDTRKHDNPYRGPKEERDAWTKGLDLKNLPEEKAEVLYYVGCTTAYKLPGIAKATATILKKAGVDFGILGRDEKCCTSPGYLIGDSKLFEECARENIKTFNDLGVKKVVMSCAGCYHMFKVYYPRVADMKFEVLHSAEFIERLMEGGKIKLTRGIPTKATYHDPCHLGRLAEPFEPWRRDIEKKVFGQMIITEPKREVRFGVKGAYDQPRKILKSIPGLQFVEMERIREYSYCCMAGGGVKSGFPDLALFGATERLEEAKATGAEAIVSCCPFCERNLGEAVEEKGERIKLYDLTELVSESME